MDPQFSVSIKCRERVKKGLTLVSQGRKTSSSSVKQREG